MLIFLIKPTHRYNKSEKLINSLAGIYSLFQSLAFIIQSLLLNLGIIQFIKISYIFEKDIKK